MSLPSSSSYEAADYDDASTEDARPSGLVTGKPKPLKYTELEGFLSAEQVRWHHDSHYGGALAKFTALDAEVTGNHRARIAKANSVVLHELYFDSMTPKQGGTPNKAVRAALEPRFGSVERWREDFRAAALASRGWATLAWHPVNARLYNMATDAHDDGPLWFGVPLVVLDMYEHSYYIDFQNRKADYVDGFLDRIDWDEVERRVRTS